MTLESQGAIIFAEVSVVKEVSGQEIDQKRLAEEEEVRKRTDDQGNTWEKVYFGGGPHFRSWLDQCLELSGKDNVEVEEVDSRGFQCFEESGEKMYRIWVKR